jgi:hypothetical protein
MPTGFVLLCLQQLLWLLEVHALVQVDPRDSAALWAPDDSSLLALLPHGLHHFSTLYQESTATCASEPQASHFAILLVPGGFPPHIIWCSPPCPYVGEPPLPCPRVENQLLHWVLICYSMGARRPASQGAQRSSTSHCACLQESPIFPAQELKSQILHWVAIH